MTDGNGTAPEPLLAGHLVIYEDALAFRPDGGGDADVVVRGLVSVARDTFLQLLASGDGGIAAAMMRGQIPPMMNRAARRAAKAAGVELPSGT